MTELAAALAALRAWQRDDAPFQLHPGDVGWFQRFGVDETAAAVRTWSDGGGIRAVGLLDGDDPLRLAIDPDAQQDRALAERIAGELQVDHLEVPSGAVIRDVLGAEGWVRDELWTPLRRDLTEPVEHPSLRIEVTDATTIEVRVAVHRATFERSIFTADSWRTMAAGDAYEDARCLVGYDGDIAVAAVTVWSAGPGRPGLIEPLGVHRDHRGRGHGRAITLAAASVLRDLGSSSATVATPSANVAGVAGYEAGGLMRMPERMDLARPSAR